MGVIAFPNFQPQGSGATELWKQRNIGARFRSSLTGVVTTYERYGSSWVCTPMFNNLDGSRRAVGQQFLANCRGFGSRFYMPTFYTRRGSFPATELLTNNTFASGTTGWSFSTNFTATAADGILRTTRTAHASTSDVMYTAAAQTVTQYAPYAIRCIDHQGSSSLFQFGVQLGSTQQGEEYGKTVSTSFGLKTFVATTVGTSAWFGLVDYDTGANMAGHHIGVSYVSMARCALVDNGPNLCLQSDAFNTTWSLSACTINANATAAPDGTTTADRITEDASVGVGHFPQQSFTVSAATDVTYCASFYAKADTRTRIDVRMREGTGGSDIFANFNVSTGVIATAASAGANWAEPRAFISSAGGGWYRCTVIGRKTSVSTSIIFMVRMTDNTGSTTWTGDGTSGLYVWRAVFAVSSHPTRGMQTTSAGDSDGTAQTGSGLYLKGLPVSTNALLVQGDWVEVITGSTSQAVRVRAPLNSDADGLGYLAFEATLRDSPLDNAAVIICNPLIRAMLDESEVEWTEHDDGYSSLEFTAAEDLV